MQSHLPSNIEFVFGPPGTGKTTCLANEVLIPLMSKEKDFKVLVLAPTNKAADVLVRRVMTLMGEEHSYQGWLVRFGVTGDAFKIGVVAPYRAQADLIEKLVASRRFPKETDVQVGTIHGFQGDECDIVLAVFNTPPTISSGKEMFLNKRNILNVSVSRAKDYLFLIMPDDATENIQRLQLVKNLEGLFKQSGDYTECSSRDIEEKIFGDRNYLEDNAFSTGHQNVNVYGKPEKRYEIRTEDNAVDVQLVDADRSETSGVRQ